MNRVGKVAFVVLMAVASPAVAQTFRPPDPAARPWATAKMNIGPIYFAPTFELSNIGVDNNVFNDEDNPVSDITGTLGMRSLIGIHAAESFILQVTQNNSYNYYRRYRSERSIDNNLVAVLEFRSRFFRPWARLAKMKTSKRIGFEIDERAERKEPVIDFGADINAAFRLGVSFAGKTGKLQFKDTEVFNGQNLSESLNQNNYVYQGLVRYQLTELSELLVGADYTRDRFPNTPDRDNDSRYYYGGLRIKSGGTFTGTATAGYREQIHQVKGVPDFTGVTADIQIGIVPSEAFKLSLGASRDMGYSYLIDYPFIVDEGASFSFTDRFSSLFDAVISASARSLIYDKTMTGEKKAMTERNYVFGFGAGYFPGGGSMRLGLTYERWQRQSPTDGRSYRDNRLSSNYRLSF